MWTFDQKTGRLSRDGRGIATGYSGHGAGRNNPAMQDRPSVGPIPRGKWHIGGVFESETHGPVCMRLMPDPGTETFGRSCFLIHGDSKRNPGTASLGCIVLPRPVRVAIATSGDTELEVI